MDEGVVLKLERSDKIDIYLLGKWFGYKNIVYRYNMYNIYIYLYVIHICTVIALTAQLRSGEESFGPVTLA